MLLPLISSPAMLAPPSLKLGHQGRGSQEEEDSGSSLKQVRNALSSGTVESDYDKIVQHRYKDMEASEGKFFKLEHCW
ncbi:Lactation elevated protein 1 [Hordeum vulgare]|nr:Lactation elevated protein 1 [Hordeum vulgare]